MSFRQIPEVRFQACLLFPAFLSQDQHRTDPGSEMERKKITLPLTRELARTLHAGDQVLLTGTIYTSRDAGHKRMCEALAKGEKIPFDPTDATIYYVGPTPAKPGAVIGSAGPTTSGRMDAYAPTMMSVGARGMIGKGARLPEVVDAMKKYDGVYFGAIGGAGALLAKCIKKAELIAYEDLGAEALRKLYFVLIMIFHDFPRSSLFAVSPVRITAFILLPSFSNIRNTNVGSLFKQCVPGTVRRFSGCLHL